MLFVILTCVFNPRIIEEDNAPEVWNLAYFSSIHKMGNKKHAVTIVG